MMKERLEKGVNYLLQNGFQIKLGESVRKECGYLAGKDDERAADVNDMFSDPDVAAIFCTRGGYGTPRILDKIDYPQIKRTPKILVGYSDITALQLAILKKANVVTFSGPMVAVEMGKGIKPFTETRFWKLLTDSNEQVKFTGINGNLRCLKKGRAGGRLLGGCLSLICSLLGTDFLPDFRNAILFIEDVGEEPYKIDRKLTQLKLSGILHRIGGLVIGRFEDCVPPSDSPSLTIDEILHDLTSDLDIPVVMDLPYGHIDIKYTLPVGVQAFLDADQGSLEILESPVI
ncbi:LD-carboxypeptidase [candidate division KSB1 bacterium]|nr:LD-carboxypeptidase [candidate division KSB1 bacterium]